MPSHTFVKWVNLYATGLLADDISEIASTFRMTVKYSDSATLEISFNLESN
jgi:hypothetical protein